MRSRFPFSSLKLNPNSMQPLSSLRSSSVNSSAMPFLLRSRLRNWRRRLSHAWLRGASHIDICFDNVFLVSGFRQNGGACSKRCRSSDSSGIMRGSERGGEEEDDGEGDGDLDDSAGERGIVFCGFLIISIVDELTKTYANY